MHGFKAILNSIELYNGLVTICNKIASVRHNYIKDWNIKLNESFYRIILCFVEKTINYSKTYQVRVNSVIIWFNLGNNVSIMKIINKLEIEMKVKGVQILEIFQANRNKKHEY